MKYLDWISVIVFCATFFSFMYMADHLYRKKIIKHRLFGLRPDIVFVQYYKITKEEDGHTGKWFWITVYGFVILIITGIISFFTDFVLRN